MPFHASRMCVRKDFSRWRLMMMDLTVSVLSHRLSKKSTCCVVYNVDAIIDEVAIKVIKFGHIRRIWI